MNNQFKGMPFPGMGGNAGNQPDMQKLQDAFRRMFTPQNAGKMMFGMWMWYAKMWEAYGRMCMDCGKKMQEALAKQAEKMPQAQPADAQKGPAGSKMPPFGAMPGLPGAGKKGMPMELDAKKVMAIAKILFSGSDVDYDYEE